jgi:hypothetical protein
VILVAENNLAKTPIPPVPGVLNDPMLNRGVAFSVAEREALGLTGRLSAAVLTLEQQAPRASATTTVAVAQSAIADGVATGKPDNLVEPVQGRDVAARLTRTGRDDRDTERRAGRGRPAGPGDPRRAHGLAATGTGRHAKPKAAEQMLAVMRPAGTNFDRIVNPPPWSAIDAGRVKQTSKLSSIILRNA